MGESQKQNQAKEFSLEERFQWSSDEEFGHIKDALDEMAEKDMVLLAANGRPFPCHRCVLSAACPFFEAMFKSGMRECRGEVKLQFPGDILELFLLYLYEGQLKVTESTFENLFFMAHLFQLRGALTFMTDLLSKSIERDNVLELFDMAISFDIPKLRFSVIDYLLSESIMNMRFEEFPFALLSALLKMDGLRVEREGQVVEIIMTWIRHEPDERERCKGELLRRVRLPHLEVSELESWQNDGLGSLELLKTLSDSNDWLRDISAEMLTKRTHTGIHLHGFWAEDSLCDHTKQELSTCNQDYLSCASLDGLLIREDWTKRPCFPVGPDLHISYHDSLRRAADFKGGWGSPDYDLAFLKMPLALNGLQSRRGQCTRRSFIFEYLRSRICCATEYKNEIIFVVGAFSEAEENTELFFMRVCRFDPRSDAHHDDDVECLTDEMELFEEYTPICCVVTQNDKLAILSAHDIKIFDLSDTSQTISLEYSISLEFEIGISAWVKDNIIYVYLVDRLKNVFDRGQGEEPPKMHYISAFSSADGFDKVFQHELDFEEKNIGYPKDVRSFIVRDTIYIIYKAIPRYKVPAEEGLYIYRYDADLQTLVKLDRFEVIRLAKNDRFPTSCVVYERDLVALVPTDMLPCQHSTLLEEFCHRYSLEASCDFSKLAALRQYQL
ncbi:uncharacterized protein LOC100906036 [Galendromus occidentalis]|uniref:Uncharacterized protein LOC100906036 n=1 Tax=Galendromus occidentalis TaxID=34638 RepID=A0AAJ7SIW3_9ACAR|nr:uncharacterized protein LOC100906036 [Galendromus occidentalis]